VLGFYFLSSAIRSDEADLVGLMLASSVDKVFLRKNAEGDTPSSFLPFILILPVYFFLGYFSILYSI